MYCIFTVLVGDKQHYKQPTVPKTEFMLNDFKAKKSIGSVTLKYTYRTGIVAVT